MKTKTLISAILISPALIFANAKDQNESKAYTLLKTIKQQNPNFEVFDSSDSSNIQMTVDDIYHKQRFNEFGSKGYALLFMPNDDNSQANYNLDIKVGYSTQVLGLGTNPDQVHITGAVRTEDAPGGGMQPGALDNFWRSVENVYITPTEGGKAIDNFTADTNVWAVSQAAPMRRVHIDGNLSFYEHGYSSGGFLANSLISGQVITGTQQQWFAMKNKYGNWGAGNYNMVFTANDGPTPTKGNFDNTVISSAAQKTRTKPYLAVKNGKLGVIIPNLLDKNTIGTDWENQNNIGTFVEVNQNNFVVPSNNDADNIQNSLKNANDGWHIAILTPGEYQLNKTVTVDNDKTLILGVGMPVIKDKSGISTPLVQTTSSKDTILAGFLIAGSDATANTTLMTIGDATSSQNNSADNPNILFDIFCRVGGPGPKDTLEKADTCLKINDNDTIGSNIWLWRADHDFSGTLENTSWNKNTANHGLIINGDNVGMYGLFVEHFQKEQTIWDGKNGTLNFYQSELPYDPTSQNAWNYKDEQGNVRLGYPSLLINKNATEFKAKGLGIYAVFINIPQGATPNYMFADNAIVDNSPVSDFTHMVTAFFSGTIGYITGINNIINDHGGKIAGDGTTPYSGEQVAYLDQYSTES